MRIKNVRVNQKSEFTRRCIGEAVLLLMENTEFNRLKISDIAKKAGVSRTTFYQYYTSPYSVLTDYLNIILSEYILSSENFSNNQYFDHEHIIFSFNFFDKYSYYFLTLTKHKLHSIMFEEINRFVLNHILPEKDIALYQLYAYAGALLNTFIQWE
ncbi:MAG: TetR/AcrR family transcriptional regulator, partial [Butyrivibrio sp.]|nr:TetR/AcrR family transcriptional regulator [Butyrivibrio sp.]